MKNLRLVIFLVVALAQLAVPAYAVWNRVKTLRTGRVWKLQTAPVDPEDAFRGRYISLRFSSEQIPLGAAMERDDTAYAVLRENAQGFAEVERLSETQMSGDNVIKVKLGGYWDGKQRFSFGFDQFWVNEAIAPAAERAYNANSSRKNLNAYVTIRVRDGDAGLEELFIDGKPLKDYLREEGAH